MTERRLINIYRPRETIPIDDIEQHPGEYAWFCLPLDGVTAIRRILPYLNREVTYVYEEVDAKSYYGPTATELEAFRDLESELEDVFMAGCDFAELVTVLEEIRDEVAAMSACTCETSYWQTRQTATLPPLDGYVDTTQVTYLTEGATRGTFTPPTTNQENCELAQAHYYYTFAMFTEEILPFAQETSDALTAAIIATAAFSSLAGFVGLPIALLSSLVASVVAWAVDGSIAEFENWLFASKDEIVCAIYEAMPDVDAAAAAVAAYVDQAEEISVLDKAVLKAVLASPWHMTWVFDDQQTNSTWDAYLVPGQCDTCESPMPPTCLEFTPCSLNDWDEGGITCEAGYPRPTSGAPRYLLGTQQVPASNPYWVVFAWIPYSFNPDYQWGEMDVMFKRVSDGSSDVVFNTGEQPAGVFRVDVFEVTDPAFLNNEVYLKYRPTVFSGELVYGCVLDYDPTL